MITKLHKSLLDRAAGRLDHFVPFSETPVSGALREGDMRLRNRMRMRLFTMSTVVMAVSAMAWVAGQQVERVPIDADDIGGTVTSAKGPEPGVWGIAETTELPTKFARIVVTDDRGRYVLPDLPRATYQV